VIRDGLDGGYTSIAVCCLAFGLELLFDGFIVGGFSLFIALPGFRWGETAGHDGVFEFWFWGRSGFLRSLLFGEGLFLAAHQFGGREGIGGVELWSFLGLGTRSFSGRKDALC
jgi:hypothetical protein